MSMSNSGVRIVAGFEAFKGVLVLAVGFGLLAALGRDVEQLAVSLVHHLHLNPARHLPSVFLEAASHTSDRRLLMLASLAMLYALLRLVEAYGLWRERRWAEWLAALSGGIYLPYELAELAAGVTPLRLATFTANLAVVAFMAWRIVKARRAGPPT